MENMTGDPINLDKSINKCLDGRLVLILVDGRPKLKLQI
jgi:hypothetical protein